MRVVSEIALPAKLVEIQGTGAKLQLGGSDDLGSSSCTLRPCHTGVPSFVRFSHARLLLYTAERHGRVSRPCQRNRIEPCPWHTRGFPFPHPWPPIKFTHGHVARPWGFIAPHVLGNHVRFNTAIVLVKVLGRLLACLYE
ncbi:hypothetical protein GOBAR_AA22864 [Gossypium barbadense]|uniref:Uncharacterized protein n=1 Tax=Gossypium barbadense TaxID=3634 RepID=A0A2P5X388_GOSBA|nr:hypothetical protein GOBAR_AA22864 [Gossypium barbadense]